MDNIQSVLEVTGVLSNVISQTIVSSAVKYDNNTQNVQKSIDSKHCRNIIIGRSDNQLYASSSVFQSTETYQSVVATVVNQIISKMKNKKSGPITPNEENKLAAAIGNMILSKLTAQNLITIGEDVITSNTNQQYCIASSGSTNFIVTTSNNIYKFYNQAYSENVLVQSVSADISNYISAVMANKSTGILTVIVRMLALIAIIILVICFAGGFVYLESIKGG